MEVSNKTIMYLLVIALAVSAGGTLISLSKLSDLRSIMGGPTGITGMAINTTGSINLTVASTIEVNLTDKIINFGSGYVAGGINCSVNSEGTSSGACMGSWLSVIDNLTLENIGNLDVQIDMSVDKNATQLLGTNSVQVTNFSIKVKSPENACGGAFNLTSYTTIGENFKSDPGSKICDSSNKLQSEINSDELEFVVWLNIPENATTGALGARINITATQ